MASKKIEELPLGNAINPATDLMHVAQWNGADYDSRHHPVQDVANALTATPLIIVDTVAATAYTFAAENYHHKRFTAATAVTATVPKNSVVPIPVGTRIRCTQAGVGQVTLTPVDGTVLLRSRDGALKSTAQYAVFEIEKVGTDEWDVLGDVSA
jgi:hypothetical protein